mmetsp:Transcript_16167/g.50591  ORF Transcript_16167/g.50591 Transcript_16167/m.50591 type:complete len:101 (-) Transcript_16167:124-426(-)
MAWALPWVARWPAAWPTQWQLPQAMQVRMTLARSEAEFDEALLVLSTAAVDDSSVQPQAGVTVHEVAGFFKRGDASTVDRSEATWLHRPLLPFPGALCFF